MARGWESKSVESQQEEHDRVTRRPAASTPEGRERAFRRQTLTLQRAKAQADLTRATKPGHRAMLERAVEDLDRQLREL